MNRTAKEVKEFYKRWSKDYDSHMTETYHYKALQRSLCKIAENIGGKMLDIAAGTGEAIRYILEEQGWEDPPHTIVTNDFSPEMLKYARRKIPQLHALWRLLADVDYKFPFSKGTRLENRLRNLRNRRKVYDPKVYFTTYDASNLGFRDESFDAVLVSYGFHWFKDKKKCSKGNSQSFKERWKVDFHRRVSINYYTFFNNEAV
jgi:ubiquinone/menaquinone biosynthesis C-methylase UbiE